MKTDTSNTLLKMIRYLSGADSLETKGERNLSNFQMILVSVAGIYIFGIQLIDPSTHFFTDLDFIFEIIGLVLLVVSNIVLRFNKYKLSQISTIMIINIITLIEVILGIENRGLFSILYISLTLILSLSITSFWISFIVYLIDLLTLSVYFAINWGKFETTEIVNQFTLLLFISFGILLSFYFQKKELVEKVSKAVKAEAYFKSIFNFVPYGIAIADLRGNISDVNDYFCKLFGYDKQEIVGLHFNNFAHHEDVEIGSSLVRKLIKNEIDHFNLEKRYIKKNGEIIWGLITVTLILDKKKKPIYTLGQIKDITEIKLLETRRREEEIRLQQSQKLEAVGTLASGIAHDFNNLLGIINGYAEILYSIETEDEHKKLIQEIQKAGEKAFIITKQLLSYGKKDDRKLRIININHVIHELNNFMNMAITDEKIKIEQELQLSIPNIYANTNELSQIMMNLLINAKDAMPEGGKISISTEQQGENIILTFKDDGIGIAEDILPKIFDPYFSTKPKGSGLGLSIVYNILSSLNGKIYVESEINKGTTFKIELPVHDPDTMPVTFDQSLEEIMIINNKSILLIEDEVELAKIITIFLEGTGYRVLTYNDPKAALAHYLRIEDKKYDMVITDVKMEGMNGVDIVKKIKEKNPVQQILFITGFGAKILENEEDFIKNIPLLQKPFTKYELLKLIQNVLSKEP